MACASCTSIGSASCTSAYRNSVNECSCSWSLLKHLDMQMNETQEQFARDVCWIRARHVTQTKVRDSKTIWLHKNQYEKPFASQLI